MSGPVAQPLVMRLDRGEVELEQHPHGSVGILIDNGSMDSGYIELNRHEMQQLRDWLNRALEWLP